ncbi:outer membrane protein/peptidoglycan-associated (lipo)protein [Galbibacter orientalis DSM 19592]|uniref:Outer membrane protein/peptidoglycan-associated (Lipo)protein n=1 Tax=Galbibacter orientalis DSM 19592 TaxID=926559 RepID=I3C1E2_9FLAO|nr:OmpA family protein [Galbibacter orientalis]EIJ37435.1 outer membrane protein/peptidoglycan-associated (lipo)protein [Galbibacter orientalis DSM 19592]
MKKILIFIAFLSFGMYAQNNTWKADELYAEYHFEAAADQYKKIIDKSTTLNPDALERLANSYFNIADYQNAYVWYDKLYNLNNERMKESTFIKYLQSAKSSRDYEKANRLIQDYYADDYSRIETITIQKRNLDEIKVSDSLYKIQNVSINSKMSDFAPIYYKDYIVFSSTRDTSVTKDKLYPWNNQPYLDLYIAEKNKENGELKDAKKFSLKSKSNFHDATLCFSKDGKFVYFTRNYSTNKKLKTNKEGVSNFEIVRGYINGDNITNIETLSFNSMKYSCGHPAISPDGKYLYFVSDMPGGYGASDIYYTEIFEDGKTNTPINLGPTINTPGREMFPFVTDSTLYFSSDAHYGLGGLDIFESKIKGKNSYEIPLNLGGSLNSNMDDFSLIYNPTNRTGYFASNRSLGKGDDDIYYFRKKEPLLFQTFSGHVYDEKTKEPLEGVSVEVKDILNDAVTQTIQTGDSGYYELELPFKMEQQLTFSKPDYTSEKIYAKTTEDPKVALRGNDVYLTSLKSLTVKEGNDLKIDVDPIYFEYNKADITPQAQVALEKVLYVMKEFPTLHIMIESHTDSRGSDSYNMSLSNSRAEHTKRYIIANGIEANRIEGARGFGESKLKNKCSNGVSCSEEEHSLNRRSNFIIVENKPDF